MLTILDRNVVKWCSCWFRTTRNKQATAIKTWLYLMAVYHFVYFRPSSSHSWYNVYQSSLCHHYNSHALGANRWSVDTSTPMYHPPHPYWPQMYEARGSSNTLAPRSAQPNPFKWVNPKLTKESHHANTQMQPNLSFHDVSDRSCKWSERSVCSPSSQSSSSISSIVPTPAYKFEPASLYKKEPEFLELWGTL